MKVVDQVVAKLPKQKRSSDQDSEFIEIFDRIFGIFGKLDNNKRQTLLDLFELPDNLQEYVSKNSRAFSNEPTLNALSLISNIENAQGFLSLPVERIFYLGIHENANWIRIKHLDTKFRRGFNIIVSGYQSTESSLEEILSLVIGIAMSEIPKNKFQFTFEKNNKQFFDIK